MSGLNSVAHSTYFEISHKDTFQVQHIKSQPAVCPPVCLHRTSFLRRKNATAARQTHWWPKKARNSRFQNQRFPEWILECFQKFSNIPKWFVSTPAIWVKDLLHFCFKEYVSKSWWTAVLNEYQKMWREHIWREPIKKQFGNMYTLTPKRDTKLNHQFLHLHWPLFFNTSTFPWILPVDGKAIFFRFTCARHRRPSRHPNKRDTAASTSQAEDSKALQKESKMGEVVLKMLEV